MSARPMDNKSATSEEVRTMKKLPNIALLIFGIVMIVSGVVKIISAF